MRDRAPFTGQSGAPRRPRAYKEPADGKRFNAAPVDGQPASEARGATVPIKGKSNMFRNCRIVILSRILSHACHLGAQMGRRRAQSHPYSRG